MKIKRKWINVALGAVAGIVVVTTAATVIGSSYSQYKSYYNDVQSQKEHQKYLDSLPLELLGITAELKDSVTYYANGRATPKADDFLVKAQFTEKGKESETILQSKDFTMSVPEDFSSKGGKISIAYTYTYKEKENASSSLESSEETPNETKTVTKTAEVDVSLTAVKLERLKMEEKPYRVYYSDNMKFSMEGAKLLAVYNDGEEKEIDPSAVSVENGGVLKAGQTNAKITYKEGGDSASFDVPINVVKETDYVDGNIVSIAQEGEVLLEEGQLLSTAKVNIRGSYANGNRLLVDPNEYTVEGNVSNASFMKNCILTIQMKNSSLFAKTAAKVINVISADEMTNENGNKKSVSAFINSSKEEKETNVIEGASSLSFKLNVSYVCKAKFNLRLANIGQEDIYLGKNVNLSVNGFEIPLGNQILLSPTKGVYSLNDILLPDLVLKEGENQIKLIIKDGNKNLAVEQFEVYNVFEGTIFSSLDDYMGEVAKKNDVFDAKLSQVTDWTSTPNPYCHGLTTDGQFIYGTTTFWSSEKRSIKVIKIDPQTSKVMATSKATSADYLESCTGITYYDGKLILFHQDGKQSYIEVNNFNDGASFIDCQVGEEILRFEGMEGKEIRDVYYNPSLERFAVLADSEVTLFGKDMKKISSFAPKIIGNYGKITRMSGTSKYILVNYSKDGNNRPTIAVYDYEGKRIGQYQIPNSLEDMGGEEKLPKPAKMNTQGIVYLNGVFYFSILRFNQATVGDAFSVMSAKLRSVKENVESKYSLGEYIGACADTYSPKETTSPVLGNLGNLSESGYQMGLASDGEYIYAAKNLNGNGSTQILKINPTTWETEESSATFDTMLPKNEDGSYPTDDNSQLMIKDDKIYTFVYPDKDKCRALSLPLNKLTNSQPVEEVLPFEGKTNARVRSCYYSDITSRYSVIDDNKLLYFFDEAGEQVGDTIQLKGYSGMSVSSITGDEKYLYVSYRVNNQPTLPVDIYTLAGSYIGQASVNGIKLGEQGFNVQSILSFKGELYAGVCSWQGEGGTYLWKVKTDSSVFPTSKLDRIEVICDTKRFVIGENIREHLKVVAHYEDGSKETIKDYSLDKEQFSSTSETSFTVSYKRGMITKTFEVTGLTVSDVALFGNIYKSNPSLSLSFTSKAIDSSVRQYLMGAVYYENYVYIASSIGGDHTPTIVSKLDPANNYKLVASKEVSNTKYGGDGSQLFVKGNDLYLINGASNPTEIWKIDLKADFMNSEKAFTKVSLPITGATGIQWNDAKNQYAALIGSKVKIYDSTGKEIKTFANDAWIDGYSASSIFADDEYIYVSFKKNAQPNVPICIYRWDGTYVGRVQIGIPSGLADTNYNIQSVFIKGNKLCATACAWGKLGVTIWEADFA